METTGEETRRGEKWKKNGINSIFSGMTGVDISKTVESIAAEVETSKVQVRLIALLLEDSEKNKYKTN